MQLLGGSAVAGKEEGRNCAFPAAGKVFRVANNFILLCAAFSGQEEVSILAKEG